MEQLNDMMMDEVEKYNEVGNPEEWELIKPTPNEKANIIMASIYSALREKGVCGNCSRWKLQALEIQEAGRFNSLDVGSWEPTQGLMLKDHLFPHVSSGLRGRAIKVTAIHVRINIHIDLNCIKKYAYHNFKLY